MRNYFVLTIMSLFSIATIFFVVKYVVVPYAQMHTWLHVAETLNKEQDKKINENSFPFKQQSLASQIIRLDLIDLVFKSQKPNSSLGINYDTALNLMEKYAAENSVYPYVYYMLARGFDEKAVATGEKKWLINAENYYHRALVLFPNRQEFLYPYAFNLFQQGKVVDAKEVLLNLYKADPTLPENSFYLGIFSINLGEKSYNDALDKMEYAFEHGFEVIDTEAFSDSYTRLFMYYYKKNDIIKTKIVATRLSTVENNQKDLFAEIVRYIKTTNSLPKLQIEER